MKTLRLAAVLGTAVAVLGAGTPGFAGTEAAPEVTDIAGDANLLNGQGPGPDSNLATAPASIDGVDLRAIWLETAYATRVETVNDVRWVRYESTGLIVNIKTTGPVKPTFGPSVIFRFPAMFGACSAYIEAWVKGSAQGAVDREYASIFRRSNCAAGPTTGFPMTITGNLIRVTLPFVQTGGMIADEMTVGPSDRPHVRNVLGSGTTYGGTAPVFDEMPLGTQFEIGSDVPADVNCSLEPAHPDCA